MTLKTATEISKKLYKIADLILEINYPNTLDLNTLLPTFCDFQCDEKGNKPTIRVNLTTEKVTFNNDKGVLRSDLSISWGDRFCFYEKEDSYITTIVNGKGNDLWYMQGSRNFDPCTVYIPESSEREQCSVISWMLMMIFGQAALLHQIIMLHASVINFNSQGIAFLGKSGTGKSTHSRLWLSHIAETSLLNDDNPAIRITEQGVMIYGTPWSGKTPCYKNECIPLKAFVRLQQAPENKFEWMEGAKAFITVLPSCSAIRWNKDLFSEMNTTLEKIISKIPVGFLKCLPDQDAAMLCHNYIVNAKTKA